MLVKQLNGKYKITEPKIQELFLELWNLKLDFKKVSLSFISRNKNKEADALAGQALDKKAKNKPLFW